jgi:spermidine/putrescine transport system permease protein
MRLSRRAAPYLLLAPGLAWLAVFFVVPMYYLANTSLQSGSLDVGYTFNWAWHNYKDALTLYQTQFLRSIYYAGVATVFALLISYPLAYWIAFRAGRWRNLFLLLVVAPFFVTYLIRTLAWETILSDGGAVVSIFQSLGILDALTSLGLTNSPDRLLATPIAVIAGITYNFLPFMVLPLYVSLEQMDGRLIEAAQDLYASKFKAFLRVTLPLSLPGVFAGTLLTFIPACGSPGQYMIGNVIQSKFLAITDYPAAAALSFVLMAAILAAVLVYARVLGTERLTG